MKGPFISLRCRVLVVALLWSLTHLAQGQIYVSSLFGSISAYTLSGGIINTSLFSAPFPEGIVSDGNLLFVAQGHGTIGEYTTSGATVNASLISGLGTPLGLTVNGT